MVRQLKALQKSNFSIKGSILLGTETESTPAASQTPLIDQTRTAQSSIGYTQQSQGKTQAIGPNTRSPRPRKKYGGQPKLKLLAIALKIDDTTLQTYLGGFSGSEEEGPTIAETIDYDYFKPANALHPLPPSRLVWLTKDPGSTSDWVVTWRPDRHWENFDDLRVFYLRKGDTFPTEVILNRPTNHWIPFRNPREYVGQGYYVSCEPRFQGALYGFGSINRIGPTLSAGEYLGWRYRWIGEFPVQYVERFANRRTLINGDNSRAPIEILTGTNNVELGRLTYRNPARGSIVGTGEFDTRLSSRGPSGQNQFTEITWLSGANSQIQIVDTGQARELTEDLSASILPGITFSGVVFEPDGTAKFMSNGTVNYQLTQTQHIRWDFEDCPPGSGSNQSTIDITSPTPLSYSITYGWNIPLELITTGIEVEATYNRSSLIYSHVDAGISPTHGAASRTANNVGPIIATTLSTNLSYTDEVFIPGAHRRYWVGEKTKNGRGVVLYGYNHYKLNCSIVRSVLFDTGLGCGESSQNSDVRKNDFSQTNDYAIWNEDVFLQIGSENYKITNQDFSILQAINTVTQGTVSIGTSEINITGLPEDYFLMFPNRRILNKNILGKLYAHLQAGTGKTLEDEYSSVITCTTENLPFYQKLIDSELKADLTIYNGPQDITTYKTTIIGFISSDEPLAPATEFAPLLDQIDPSFTGVGIPSGFELEESFIYQGDGPLVNIRLTSLTLRIDKTLNLKFDNRAIPNTGQVVIHLNPDVNFFEPAVFVQTEDVNGAWSEQKIESDIYQRDPPGSGAEDAKAPDMVNHKEHYLTGRVDSKDGLASVFLTNRRLSDGQSKIYANRVNIVSAGSDGSQKLARYERVDQPIEVKNSNNINNMSNRDRFDSLLAFSQ